MGGLKEQPNTCQFHIKGQKRGREERGKYPNTPMQRLGPKNLC